MSDDMVERVARAMRRYLTKQPTTSDYVLWAAILVLLAWWAK